MCNPCWTQRKAITRRVAKSAVNCQGVRKKMLRMSTTVWRPQLSNVCNCQMPQTAQRQEICPLRPPTRPWAPLNHRLAARMFKCFAFLTHSTLFALPSSNCKNSITCVCVLNLRSGTQLAFWNTLRSKTQLAFWNTTCVLCSCVLKTLRSGATKLRAPPAR